MNFKELLNQITSNPSEVVIKIQGNEKVIRGMAQFTTRNMPKHPYIKILFEDGSFLLLMITDEEVYYADKVVGHIDSISDEQIGNQKRLKYEGKEYELDNKNDYQWVTKLYEGSFEHEDIEGEARFSDYFPIEGEKEFLSLGWLSETGERSDINPVFIDFNQVEIIQE